MFLAIQAQYKSFWHFNRQRFPWMTPQSYTTCTILMVKTLRKDCNSGPAPQLLTFQRKFYGIDCLKTQHCR